MNSSFNKEYLSIFNNDILDDDEADDDYNVFEDMEENGRYYEEKPYY